MTFQEKSDYQVATIEEKSFRRNIFFLLSNPQSAFTSAATVNNFALCVPSQDKCTSESGYERERVVVVGVAEPEPSVGALAAGGHGSVGVDDEGAVLAADDLLSDLERLSSHQPVARVTWK